MHLGIRNQIDRQLLLFGIGKYRLLHINSIIAIRIDFQICIIQQQQLHYESAISNKLHSTSWSKYN